MSNLKEFSKRLKEKLKVAPEHYEFWIDKIKKEMEEEEKIYDC